MSYFWVAVLFSSGPLKEDCQWHKQIYLWHQILCFSLSSSEPDTSGSTFKLEMLCPGLQILAFPPPQMLSSSILKCMSGFGLSYYSFNSLLVRNILKKPLSARLWSLYRCIRLSGSTGLKCASKAIGVHIHEEFGLLLFPDLFQGYGYLEGWLRRDESIGYVT